MTREEAENEIAYLPELSPDEIMQEYKVDTVEEAEKLIREQIDDDVDEYIHEEDIYQANGFRDMSDYNRFINGY